MDIPCELEPMVRDDDLGRLRVEVRSLFAPVPPVLVTGAAAMTVGCALLSVLLVSLGTSSPLGLALTLAMAALSASAMAVVLGAADRSAAWLEVQVAPHHLRLIAHHPWRSRVWRPHVRTVALGDLLAAEVVGDDIVLQTRTSVYRVRLPDRGEPTRTGVDRLLRLVARRAHTFGSPEEVPLDLTRWPAPARAGQ